jgi:hypothetical protein
MPLIMGIVLGYNIPLIELHFVFEIKLLEFIIQGTNYH